MTLENITPQLIEDLLKAWQKGSFSAEDLKNLNLSSTEMQSFEQQRLYLRDMLYHLVLGKLSQPCQDVIESREPEKAFFARDALFRGTPSEELYFALIYCRYMDIKKHSVSELAAKSGVSSRTLRRYLLKGFSTISIEIKAEFSKKLAKEDTSSTEGYFPAVETEQLIGIDANVAKITAWLLNDAAPHAISIEGIGGIGKTVIAQRLLHQLRQNAQFDGYAWVSARQNELTFLGEISPVEKFSFTLDDVIVRLAHQLGQSHIAGLSTQNKLSGLQTITQQKPYLIFIDNLETVDDVDSLVPALLKLTGPSKLVITSRKSLSKNPHVRTFPTPELSFENSRLLIITEMQRRGITLSLSEETISALYDVTGGIPLALKLATAQFGFYSAKEIIQQLRLGEEVSHNMYAYIYRQSWLLLDDTAKRLLLSMLLVSPDGEDRQWICDIGNISAVEFKEGLRQLKRLSLIEFSGTIEAPLYRIHRLTATFLQTDILQGWDNSIL